MKIFSNLTAYPGSPTRIILHLTRPDVPGAKQRFNDVFYELLHNDFVTIPDDDFELLQADLADGSPSAFQEIRDTPDVKIIVTNDDGSPPDNGGGNGGGNDNGDDGKTQQQTIQTAKVSVPKEEAVTEAEPVAEPPAQTTEARRRSRSQKKN